MRRFFASLLLLFAAFAARAEMLDSLPRVPDEPLTAELRALAARTVPAPADANQAAQVAREWYRQATVEGELRFVGYARGALERWWKLAAPPGDVLLMRANLRQYVHDFDAAIADLDALLAREPGHAQALAVRAAIRQVRAEYALARADCARLAPLVSELIGFTCGAAIDGLTGQAQASYQAIARVLARNVRAPAEQRLWVALRLAELAERLGMREAAERHYRQALLANLRDQYTLVNYADFLLDGGRAEEVVRLLKDRTAAEHLLLRLVLAEKALGAPGYEAHAREVEAQFAAARAAGHAVHEQEESRFVLHVLGDAPRALKLALSNWRLQKEPRDARAVLEAATAAGDDQAARPVLDWMSANSIADVRLAALVGGAAARRVRL